MKRHNVYHSPYPMPDVPLHQSISQFLLESDPDDAHPDSLIWSDYDNTGYTVSYRELRDNAARDAATLQRRYGLVEGDVVCIYAYNSVDWASLAHAVLWAGGCFCGINPLATSFELVHYFQVASPKIIAVDRDLLANVQEAFKGFGKSPQILVLNKGRPSATGNRHPVYPRDFARGSTIPVEPFDLTSRDNRKQPGGMCFSSGTSGKPKSVVYSHYNLMAQIMALRSTNPFVNNAHTREVFFPSFAHVYGVVSGLLMPAWVGSYMQAMKTFDYLSYLRRCSEIKATVLRLVPAAAVRMVKDPDVRSLDLTSVGAVMCSGAALSDATVEGLREMLAPGAGVLNGYGMSEATVTLLREGRRDKGASVGRPSAGVSVRIVDDDFNDVEPGTDGECVVRGPTVFMGYKGNPTATAESRRDGWLLSGDIVRADKDGYFYLTGRKKELIKFKGNQIAPTELEAVLLLHPRVADAGVCGAYDKTLDTEIPIGFVTLREDVPTEKREDMLEEVREFVNTRVAPYKKFREKLHYLGSLPKNTSGKLLRRHLTAMATEIRTRRAKL